MKILFIRGTSPLSKAIIAVTDEPVSHVAMDFGWFVVHSDLRGVHLTFGPIFRKTHNMVFTLDRTVGGQHLQDAGRLSSLLEKYEYSLYDLGGLLFLGIVLLARKNLKVPLPKSNLWQSSGMFMCTEWVSEFINDEQDSMITPYKLYEKLKLTGQWRDYVNQAQSTPGISDR